MAETTHCPFNLGSGGNDVLQLPEGIACDGWFSAQKGFWDYFIGGYWKRYEDNYGNKPDPHIKGNTYWETSHSVIYDLESKKGYLYPFENFYSNDGKPIVICLPK